MKVAGTEGNFNTLLTRARYEEARLRDLASTQQGHQGSFLGKQVYVSTPAQATDHEPGANRSVFWCYGCGTLGHYRNKCPGRGKGGGSRDPQSAKIGEGRVANLMSEDLKPSGDQDHSAEARSVEALLEQVASTVYSIMGEEQN